TEANRRHLAGIADGVPVHCVYHGLNADLARLLAAAPSGPTPTGPPIRALVRAQGVAVEATIVGDDGAHGAEVRRRIGARGLADAVRLVGPLGQAALLDEYLRATVFCLPCRVAEDGDRDG